LIGHILIGMRMVDDKIRQISGFPPRLKTLVEHLILSHHGEMEYGSPKVPMFAEAMLLHHLDNLDSKMETIRGSIERDKLETGNWTAWVPSLERTILKKEKYLEPPPPPAPTPVEPPKRERPQAQQPSLFADKLKGALTGE
jgi:3'-5' exoribonuclease